jgi:hypothetical protein
LNEAKSGITPNPRRVISRISPEFNPGYATFASRLVTTRAR